MSPTRATFLLDKQRKVRHCSVYPRYCTAWNGTTLHCTKLVYATLHCNKLYCLLISVQVRGQEP